MNFFFIDFESYWDTKAGYTLKKMSMTEYIRDERFKAFGVATRYDADVFSDQKSKWMLHADIPSLATSIPWDKTVLVGQNLKFDGSILAWKYNMPKPMLYLDTLALARAVLGTKVRNHSLRTLAEYYNFEPKGEMHTDGLKDLTPEQMAELGAYSCHDNDLCHDICKKLLAYFPMEQMDILDWTIRSFIYPKLVINVPLIQAAAVKEKERRDNIFKEIGIEKGVFSSNDKFSELLRSKGYEVPMKISPSAAKKGIKKEIPALAVGDTEFVEMLESENEELATLCEARVAAKSALLETRAVKFGKLGLTGAFPFDVNYSGAVQTHRFSGGNGGGGNPQNLKNGSALRECIEAPEGFNLLVADFSNIELRENGWLAGDDEIISAIIQDIDLYCKMASIFYGREITKKDELERKLGKEVELACGYGMGWKKLVKRIKLKVGIDLGEQEAKDLIKMYRSKHIDVVALWKKLDNMLPLMALGARGRVPTTLPLFYYGNTIKLPSGLMLKYPQLRSHEFIDDRGKKRRGFIYTAYKKNKAADNVPTWGGTMEENLCQALAGELCKMAMTRLFENPDVGKDLVVGQCHDELLVLEPKGKDYKNYVRDAFTLPCPWWPELKLGVSVGRGRNWLEAKNNAE